MAVVGFLLAGGTACTDVPYGGIDPQPVISFVLMAGESVQVASVTLGFNPDDSIPLHSPPVPAAEVALRVTGPDSVPYTLSPIPGNPGYYEAALAVVPGSTYQLDGLVAGNVVLARTVVPLQFTILAPAGDTVVVVPGTSGFTDTATYRFSGVGVAGFEASVLDQFIHVHGNPILADSGRLFFSRNVPVESFTPMLIAAYNRDASGWLQQATPAMNISGALGGFGAAILRRLTLWYQCPC